MDKVILFLLFAVCAISTIEACSNKPDKVHCKWGEWKVGKCSKTCGDGTRKNTRSKAVTEKHGGNKCSGKSEEVVHCKEKECPVHCEWNDWVIGECSLPCGGGVRTNKRTEKVSAKHGGQKCPGASSEEVSCNVQECPIDCEWGNWEAGECSKECGGGIQPVGRVIARHAAHGGKACEGEGYKEQECNAHHCPVDCVWGEYEFDECSLTCGGGTTLGIRSVASEAKYGGAPCDLKDNMRSDACNTEACPPIHCEWGEWVAGECSHECGEGTQELTREKLVEEANGGTCTGKPNGTVSCMLKECPIHCEWNDWVEGECDLPCGGGISIHTRTEKVSAEHGGDECPGDATQEVSCNTQECPVDCVWSDWTIGECSQTCGEGKRNNTRTKVLAQFGGKECEGEGSAVEDCDLPECPVCKDGNEWCKTYVDVAGKGMCDSEWFTDVNGRYGCLLSCDLC